MSRPLALADIERIVTVESTAIAPDGSSIVFTRVEHVDGERVSSLWRAAPGEEPARLTLGPRDRAPAFLPDGRSLVFLGEIDGAPHVFLLHVEGLVRRRLTAAELGHGVADVAVSPDGTRLALTAPVSGRDAGPDAPIVVDRLWYTVDGAGWIGDVRRHLFVVDLTDGAIRRLTEGEWDAGAPAWSPDGTRIAFTAARDDDAEVGLTRSAWIVDVHGARQEGGMPVPRRAGGATGVAGPVVWTPEGDAVVAIGSAAPRTGNAGLLRLDAGGALPDRGLTGALDRNVMPGAPAYPGGRPTFTDSGELLFCVRDRGRTHLYALAADGGARPLVAGAEQVVSCLSVATQAPRAAVVLQTPASFGEVALIELDAVGTVHVLTALTAEAMGDVSLFVPEPRTVTVSDGTEIDAWILAAPETAGSAPLLLDIHGGPHNAWSGVADDIHLYQQLLAARGWRVLMVNPRGSDGYGDDFLRAVDGAWGVADLRDFLEPVDRLVAEGLADPARLAVTGYSYGGFAACELTTRTDRFAAAVAGGLICDLVPIAASGENDAFFSRLAAGVDPTGAHRALLDASPISRVERVRTPTLILHGTDDMLCPIGQAQEWFGALRARGVPARMVAYPGGAHVFLLDGPLAHRLDYHTRLVEWLAEWAETGGTGGAPW